MKTGYLFLALFLGLFLPKTIYAEVMIHVIDVGYGSAVHLESGFNHFLFDVGPKEARQKLVQHLAQKGVTRITGIFLSHSHKDHVGNLSFLLSQFPVEAIYWNEDWPPDEDEVSELTNIQERVPFKKLNHDTSLWLGKKIKLRVLNSTLKTSNLNDNSLVFGIQKGKSKILLTGDIGLSRQENLVALESKWLKKVNFFLWPHHGDQLISALPKKIKKSNFCVVSVGENPYNLPSKNMLSQAEEFCDTFFRTDKTGTLSFLIRRNIHLFKGKE